jgi:hypothetical protein
VKARKYRNLQVADATGNKNNQQRIRRKDGKDEAKSKEKRNEVTPRRRKGKTRQERTGTNPCRVKGKSVKRDTATREMPSGELDLESALRMAESTAQFELGIQLVYREVVTPSSNEPFLPQALIRG